MRDWYTILVGTEENWLDKYRLPLQHLVQSQRVKICTFTLSTYVLCIMYASTLSDNLTDDANIYVALNVTKLFFTYKALH